MTAVEANEAGGWACNNNEGLRQKKQADAKRRTVFEARHDKTRCDTVNTLLREATRHGRMQ